MNGDTKTSREATAIAMAVPTGQADDVLVEERKQGSLCCGCCCDLRRAVIVMESLAMIWSIFPIVVNALFIGTQHWNRGIPTQTEFINIAFCIVNILAAAVGLAGAVKFNTKYLVKAAAWDCFLLLYMIYTIVVYMPALGPYHDQPKNDQRDSLYLLTSLYYIGGVIYHGILLYPTIALVKEIQNGTASAVPTAADPGKGP